MACTLPRPGKAFYGLGIQEIIGGWIRRKASVLAALLFSCANYFYKKAKQYFSPCPKLPRLETLWENLETRWIRNTAYLFCKSCFARRESKGGGVSPLLSALLIYPLSISCSAAARKLRCACLYGPRILYKDKRCVK